MAIARYLHIYFGRVWKKVLNGELQNTAKMFCDRIYFTLKIDTYSKFSIKDITTENGKSSHSNYVIANSLSL